METIRTRTARPIRRIRPGDPIPTREPNGKYRTSDGYIVWRWLNGDHYLEALEHRIIDGHVTTAQHIHHINHDPLDNRPENLRPATPREHRRAHSHVDWDEAWRLYQQGLSTITVGERLGCDPATISRGLRGRGYTLRGTGDTQRIHLPAGDVQDLYMAGVSPARVANLLGVHGTTVARTVRELGLPARRPGRPVSSTLRRADEAIAAWQSKRDTNVGGNLVADAAG